MPYHHTSIYYVCAIIAILFIPMSLTECPRLCECKWKSGKESVICMNANLTVVPLLESSTQILDLTENNFLTLKNEEFSKAGLVNLQKVFLAKCHLKSIERYVFKNLINLMELDISYNALSSVPSDAFESIPELRELKLSGNPILKISSNAFSNTPQLIRLEMSGCRLTLIEPKSFLGVESSLEWLKLDQNRLTEVDASVFAMFQNLHGLELVGNPWNCSCRLRELREWMLLQNVPYDIPPVCQYPKRLFQKSWKNLDLDEFACAPKIFANEYKTRGVEGRNVTLSCSIDGIPKPNVKWLLRSRVIANLSSSSHYSGKKMYILSESKNLSALTIFTADIQDAGTYMCSAENKAGKAEAVVTLSVSKKSPENRFSRKALLISVLLGLSFTFLCCLFAACFFRVRKKRVLKWHTNDCRRDDNYEKIEMKQKMVRNVNGGVSREDSALMTITRKNGDYSVVPGTDTDHEGDEEESTLEITTPGASNEKKWSNEAELVDPLIKSVDRTKDQVAAEEVSQDSRDNIRRVSSSTSGTYNSSPKFSSITSPSLWKEQPALNIVYTTNSIRQVPDVIGHSPLNKILSSRAQSENGSVNDINELFCTLPRKRDLARYKSSDSQSLLLPESRYGSESASSSESFTRRMSVESQRYPITNLNRNKTNKISNSFLNLTTEEKRRDLNSTPLLDISSLESRVSFKTHQVEGPKTNPYDFHAAQLERFLEEYRLLQKQLTKMKETCDNICHEQLKENSPCTASNSSSEQSSNLNNQISSPNSNRSIQDSVDFRNFENELTKYLLSRSSSTKNFATTVLHN